MTPEEVVTDLLPSMPEGAYITAALVAVTYSVPGAEDPYERGPFLRWACDGEERASTGQRVHRSSPRRRRFCSRPAGTRSILRRRLGRRAGAPAVVTPPAKQ